MPTMPNVVGLELTEAETSLETAGVLNLAAIGYFGTWPITVDWIEAEVEPFFITAQSPAPNTTIGQNSTVTLTVANAPIGVVYP